MEDSTRNRIGFAFLGISNNFGYTLMLSAALDLLNESNNHNSTAANDWKLQINTSQLYSNLTVIEKKPFCLPYSTSSILMANTVPALFVKLVYPIILVSIQTKYKFIAIALLNALSYIITGLTTDITIIFIGVVLVAFGSGIGDPTILSSVPIYGKSVAISGYGIGTGLAGIITATSYLILKSFLSTQVIMLIMLVWPCLMLYSYFFVIVPINSEIPNHTNDRLVTNIQILDSTNLRDQHESKRNRSFKDYNTIESSNSSRQSSQISLVSGNPQSVAGYTVELNQGNIDECDISDRLCFRDKLKILPSIWEYFWPLFTVYFAEYFINQALFELIYFPEQTSLDHEAQYRWFQVAYQIGVFISRCSLELFKIRQLWLLSTLQFINMFLFLLHAIKIIHIPNFFLVLAMIVYEGLLGGFSYVNTYHRVSKEYDPRFKSYAISVVTNSDTFGISIAAIIGIPTHRLICHYYYDS